MLASSVNFFEAVSKLKLNINLTLKKKKVPPVQFLQNRECDFVLVCDNSAAMFGYGKMKS